MRKNVFKLALALGAAMLFGFAGCKAQIDEPELSTPSGYTVGISAGIKNGRVSADKQTAEKGQTVILTLAANAGYQFNSISVRDASNKRVEIETVTAGTKYTFVMPESNVTVGAIFSSRRYNVGISEYVENGRVTADKLTAQMGQIVSFTLTANEGYKLRSISVRDASNNGVGISTVKARTKYMFVMPASDVTLGASFVPESVAPTGYTVDISSGIENGIVTADKLTAQKDETVTLTLSASEGYEFDSISVKDASNNSVETTAVTAGTKYTFVMPESDVTVGASFTPKRYTVCISEDIENGTVTTDKLTAQKGQTVTLTLTASEGYEFDSISVKDASNNSVETTAVTAGTKYTFVMPESNVTVGASFSPDTPIETSYTVLDAGTTGTMGTSGTYVLFGYWPQTIKSDSVTVDETNSKRAGAYTYYKGSDGAWYAKIKENAYQTGYKYSNGTTVAQDSANSYKYFKVEPIKWRVLTDNYSGKRLLLAESILVNHRYAAGSNNYANSEIRAYLNDTFWNTAFTDSEKSMIDETDVDNSAASTNPASNPNQWNSGTNNYACGTTKDKIFLLSEKEATTTDYGFASYSSYGTGSARLTVAIGVTRAAWTAVAALTPATTASTILISACVRL